MLVRHHRLLAVGWQAVLGCLDRAQEQAGRWAISRLMFRAWRSTAQSCSRRASFCHLATIRRRALHPRGCRSEQAWRMQRLLQQGLQAFAAPALAAHMHCRGRVLQACMWLWQTVALQSRLAHAERQRLLCHRCGAIRLRQLRTTSTVQNARTCQCQTMYMWQAAYCKVR